MVSIFASPIMFNLSEPQITVYAQQAIKTRLTCQQMLRLGRAIAGDIYSLAILISSPFKLNLISGLGLAGWRRQGFPRPQVKVSSVPGTGNNLSLNLTVLLMAHLDGCMCCR